MKEPIATEAVNPDAGDICFCGICLDWLTDGDSYELNPVRSAADDDSDPSGVLAAPLAAAVPA